MTTSNYQNCPLWVKDFIIHTISLEGDYSDHKDDVGGKTKYGIIERVARENGYSGEMSDLTKGFAQEIYASEYYYRPNFHLMEDCSEAITKELFDTGVNCGQRIPVKMLQRVLNALNLKESLYEDLVVDGLLGNKTVMAYKSLCDKRGELETERVVYNALNALQTVHYLEISEKREANESFTWGWISKRVNYLEQPF